MTGTTESGKKASETRSRNEDSQNFGNRENQASQSASGQKQGNASNLSDADRSKGGQHSHAGGRNQRDE